MLVQQHKMVNVTEMVLWAIVIASIAAIVIMGIVTSDWSTGAPQFAPTVDPFPGWG